MGLAIAPPPEALGDAVDDIAFGFGEMKVLLGAGEPAPRAILTRYLRSILRCEIVDADGRGEPTAGIGGLDLAVIDLDSSGPQGLDLYARLRTGAETSSVPTLALAHIERDRAQALRAGFDEAQANPPVFAELQAAVLRCLARPLAPASDGRDGRARTLTPTTTRR
jgi:DNA-binding response OmpR family regulator